MVANETNLRGIIYFHDSHYALWHGVIVVPMCLLGLLGNIASLVVLCKPQMKSSANTMLIALAICDSFVCIVMFFIAFEDIANYCGTMPDYGYYLKCSSLVLMNIGRTSRTGSVFVTIGVTVERYLVICWPFKARYLCTKNKVLVALVIIIICTIVSTIPEYLWVNNYEYLCRLTSKCFFLFFIDFATFSKL